MEDQNPVTPPVQPPVAPPVVPPTEPTPPPEIMIPKHRFDSISKAHQEAEARLATISKELEEANKAKETVAALQKQIEELKKGYEAEKTSAQRMAAIDAAIGDKTIDLDVVKKLLDLDKVIIDKEGKITGLDEQIKELQASKPFLWKKSQPVVKASAKGEAGEKSFAQALAEKKKASESIGAKTSHYFKG